MPLDTPCLFLPHRTMAQNLVMLNTCSFIQETCIAPLQETTISFEILQCNIANQGT